MDFNQRQQVIDSKANGNTFAKSMDDIREEQEKIEENPPMVTCSHCGGYELESEAITYFNHRHLINEPCDDDCKEYTCMVCSKKEEEYFNDRRQNQ